MPLLKRQCKWKQFIYVSFFSYSWYARTLVVPNLIEKKSYYFGFLCDSSFNKNNSSYDIVCKYHPNQLDPKILPKRPPVATKRCFTKLDNTFSFIGVSELHLLIFCNPILYFIFMTGAWYYMGYTLQRPIRMLWSLRWNRM